MRGRFVPIFACLCVLSPAEVSAIYGEYRPTGSVPRAPAITWKLTPTGGGHIGRVEMRINGQPVVAAYNAASGMIEGKPAASLTPGLYAVDCEATIENQLVARQDWSFVVMSGATAPGNKGAAPIFDAVNALRTELGLPSMVPDDRISAAADAHSLYQNLNGLTCHEEEPDKPGFTGKAPWDRLQHFGVPGPCYEGACGNQTDIGKAIRLLFDAPYHRIAFLQPGTPSFGAGFEGGSLTIDYAVSDKEGTEVSPAPDQTGTPLAWDGNESPSPLRVFGADGPVGYPIVFAWYSPKLETIRVSSAKLTGPNHGEIPAYVNTPGNDSELRFAAVITPKRALAPRTTYTVEVHATTERHVRIDRTWSFTTGD